MSRWLIVRHAETLWNLEGRVQGQTDISLSKEGFRQAEALRTRLALLPDIHAAYSSDLKRSIETARTILRGRDLSHSLSPELREFSHGRWEGMTHQEAEEADPILYAEMLKRPDDYTSLGGENIRDVIARVSSFVLRLKTAQPTDETLLIVGHGGSLRVLFTVLLELPSPAARLFSLDSASLSVVDCYPDNPVLRLLNDTSHWRDSGSGGGGL